MADFDSGATGVIESSKLARGHGSGPAGHDWAELNGEEATAVYQLRDPYHVLIGRRGGSLERYEVPREFWKVPFAERDVEGDPATVWRYDQVFEFVQAIKEGRDCYPSFFDGYRCQQVMDAVIQSDAQGKWVNVPPP